MKSLTVSWDRDYGIDRRTGWSFSYNGSYLVQLERSFIRAAWQAIKAWRQHDS